MKWILSNQIFCETECLPIGIVDYSISPGIFLTSGDLNLIDETLNYSKHVSKISKILFSHVSDGKEAVNEAVKDLNLNTSKMSPKRPVGNVYINDRGKHHVTSGHKPL